MLEPQYSWDPVAKAAYLKLDNAQWNRSDSIQLGNIDGVSLVIDFDKQGHVIGIEVLV